MVRSCPGTIDYVNAHAMVKDGRIHPPNGNLSRTMAAAVD